VQQDEHTDLIRTELILCLGSRHVDCLRGNWGIDSRGVIARCASPRKTSGSKD
jgi:hypothetical protein